MSGIPTRPACSGCRPTTRVKCKGSLWSIPAVLPMGHTNRESIDQEREYVCCGHGPCEVVALRNVAAGLSKPFSLAGGLNPLGETTQIERLGHSDDRAGEGGCLLVDIDAVNERTVNLDDVERELAQ